MKCAPSLGARFPELLSDPDAGSVLASLRAAGLRTAIVSNTPWGTPGNDEVKYLSDLRVTQNRFKDG